MSKVDHFDALVGVIDSIEDQEIPEPNLANLDANFRGRIFGDRVATWPLFKAIYQVR